MAEAPIHRGAIIILVAAFLIFLATIILILSIKLFGSVAAEESPKESNTEKTSPPQENITHPTKNHVIVRTGRHGVYGRLVFDWREPVDYSKQEKRDEVVITFKETAPIDVSHVADALSDYVLKATSEVGNNQLRIAIKLCRGAVTGISKWHDVIVIDFANFDDCRREPSSNA